ncbi:secondary thiamine-phosphate synthase enzyme [Methylomagnum ishizawai]|uniref:Secondary thiamine-phosphate synthase enzyme n=1 Tax=Methylomagnum ishizawai TaxID=1760988 RepID=A0A1Y6D1T9_9GAMM|nr:secondary thiamine-phosphate synthase enzyme YjbQ [Methylomagnum ishizawai]SMF96909.1 secondary thiamine-phosphate synthase enzyme [Methylomagnum ishizawai]
MWLQKTIVLKSRSRGFHLVTEELLAQIPEIRRIQVGLAHFFIQHTSASLTLNENADPSVRRDLETHLRQLVPDGAAHYVHRLEGPDDMPAHIKASLLGAAVSIPIGGGGLQLGTWQGIYLGEHRDHGGPRSVVATLNGETF